MIKEIKDKIDILILTLKCYYQGDSWKDASWYAENIVKGWKIKEKK